MNAIAHLLNLRRYFVLVPVRRAHSYAGYFAFLTVFVLTSCAEKQAIEESIEDARLAIRRHDFAAGKQILDEALRKAPKHSEVLLYRAQLAREMKDDADALVWLEKITDTSPNVVSKASFLEGSIRLAMQQAKLAESKLLKAAELDTGYLQPHERLLSLYTLQRRPAEILKQIAAISKLRALRISELALQLTARERLIDPQTAIPQLEAFITKDPDDVHSQFAVAFYYAEATRPKQAIAALRDLLVRYPGHQLARAALAELLIEQQDTVGAGAVLDGIELVDSTPLELWRSGGAYFLSCEEWERAAECFAFVVSRDSLDRTSLNRLGLTLQRLGKITLSETALIQTAKIAKMREQFEALGIQLMRNNLRIEDVIHLADTLSDLEELDRASVWYEQALKMDPQSEAARTGLKQLQTRSAKTIRQLVAASPRAAGPVIIRSETSKKTQKIEAANSSSAAPIHFRDDHQALGLNFWYFNGESEFRYLIESMGGGVGVIDFDADGWPDLYFPQGNDIFNPKGGDVHRLDQLYRNLGGKGFVAIPLTAGVGDPGYGQGVAIGDFNNDGFDDILVTNFGRSSLLQNQGDGTFTNISEAAGLTASEMSTSAGWGDFDQDGLLDLFIVNYVDSLKICRNDKGKISTCNPSNHLGIDDRIYRNRGDGQFEDISMTCGLAAEGKGLGLLLADLNDDGKIDAFVANDTTPNFLYLNRSSPDEIRFSEEGLLSGVALGETGNPQAGMGIACGDINGDLRLDLYVSYFHREANSLYLNQGAGVFHDATRSSNLYQATLNLLGFGTQAVDFDLDGQLELIVTNGHIDDQRAVGVPWKMPPQLLVANHGLNFLDRSHEAGDYFQGEYLGRGLVRLDWNRDGRPDVVIVHQDSPVALLTNLTEPAGHFLELQLRGTSANRSAIGARVDLICGDQTRRADVTSGDGYYCSNEKKLIFGLGAHEQVDRMEIHWPGGEIEVHEHLPAQTRWMAIQGKKLIEMNP